MAAKGALLTGLAVFGAATAVGGLVDSPGALIAVWAVMGVGAAVIFLATLAIISNLYTERARAIGVWGAMTGLWVALGPISGGWLLEHFWWGSVFVAMAPVAAVSRTGRCASAQPAWRLRSGALPRRKAAARKAAESGDIHTGLDSTRDRRHPSGVRTTWKW